MEKIGDKAGVTGGKTGLIPGLIFATGTIPTSYATFSTGCPFRTGRSALHLGFIIELSRYPQA